MNLKTILQSEVSQNENNEYQYQCIYVESRKMVHRWTYLQGTNRDADVENGHVGMDGGRGGMNWEVASGKVLYRTGSSAQDSVMP